MFKFLKRLFGFGKSEETKSVMPTIDYSKMVYHTEPEQASAATWETNPNVEGSKAFNEANAATIAEQKAQKPKQERTSPAERGIDQLGMPKLPSNEGTKPSKKRRPYKKRKPKTMKAQDKQA